jgi:hypothetical protein
MAVTTIKDLIATWSSDSTSSSVMLAAAKQTVQIRKNSHKTDRMSNLKHHSQHEVSVT